VTAQGWNAPDLRKRNRAGILRLVHRQGDIARHELALALGLTKAAVTILVNELIDDGLIVEAGEQAGAKRADSDDHMRRRAAHLGKQVEAEGCDRLNRHQDQDCGQAQGDGVAAQIECRAQQASAEAR